eukprot:1158437-Pelagomonas_calceolata.AAC.6
MAFAGLLGIVRFTFGDPGSLVDFIHCDNLCQGMMKAAEGLSEEKRAVAGGQLLSISSGSHIIGSLGPVFSVLDFKQGGAHCLGSVLVQLFVSYEVVIGTFCLRFLVKMVLRLTTVCLYVFILTTLLVICTMFPPRTAARGSGIDAGM